MRPPHKLHLGIDGNAVGTDSHPRFFHRRAHVVFAHRKINRIRKCFFRNEQITERIDGVFSHQLGDFIHALAFVLLVVRFLHGRDHYSVPSSGTLHVILPAVDADCDHLPDFLATLQIP